MKATLIFSPIVAATMNVLRIAAVERNEPSTVKALDRIVDYMTRDGGINFEIEGGEMTLKSAQAAVGGQRKDDSYVCTETTCTCPAGESRASALAYLDRVGAEKAGKVVIRMCWHIQFNNLVVTLSRLAPIIGETLVDQSLVTEPVLLELPIKVAK